ncbi:MAG TPA: DUF4426 domain-containing protein [Pseudomonadales bacterium]|nr:DUF4426 domain-containing protein [Pseudomonadales bacterium]
MIKHLFWFMLAFAALPAAADQFKSFDGIDVHYIVVNTLFLQPDVAARYKVVRANDRAIVNLSVIDEKGSAILAEVTGSTVNLLSQTHPLQFAVINEGDSIYYVAPFQYTDQDVLRFRVSISVPGRAPMDLEFQQQMYLGIPQ